uniref:Putative cysteine-rich protein n=1 Tax=Passion fruit mosaic virus-TGP TaxID=1167305 RepID=F8UKG2_9VIRU|nr:putative cysteine-rich protein [Passion fruit mosaic virus-TGP]
MSLVGKFAQSLGFCDLLLIDANVHRLTGEEKVIQKTSEYLQFFNSIIIRCCAVKTSGCVSFVQVRVCCNSCRRNSFCTFRCPGVKVAVSQQLVYPGEYVLRPWKAPIPYTYKPVVYLNCTNFEHVATCTECAGCGPAARLSEPEQFCENTVAGSGKAGSGEVTEEDVRFDGDGCSEDIPEGKNGIPVTSHGENQGSG